MFYCNDCAVKREWPQNTMLRSFGNCEICRADAVCNDVPSRLLPIPPHMRKAPCDHVIGAEVDRMDVKWIEASEKRDIYQFAYCPRCGERLPEAE